MTENLGFADVLTILAIVIGGVGSIVVPMILWINQTMNRRFDDAQRAMNQRFDDAQRANDQAHAAIGENIRDRAKELREDMREIRADLRTVMPRAAAESRPDDRQA